MALDKTFASGEVLSAGDANAYMRSMWSPIDKRVIASGSPVSSVSFAGLDSNFRLFRLNVHLTPVTGGFGFRLNNDSGANYNTQSLTGDGATASASRAVGATSMDIGGGTPCLGQCLFGKPSTTTQGRMSVTYTFDTGATLRTGMVSGWWNNTAALINRIDVVGVAAGTFHGVVALEGMRGV